MNTMIVSSVGSIINTDGDSLMLNDCMFLEKLIEGELCEMVESDGLLAETNAKATTVSGLVIGNSN